MMFMGPFDMGGTFKAENLEGVWRFLNRFWSLVTETWLEYPDQTETAESKAVERLRHKTIKKVTEELASMRFNTALAALMECNNTLIKQQSSQVARSASFQRTLESIIQLLAPIAPHITEELWQATDHTGSLHDTAWPEYDEAQTIDDVFTLVVQVNGKVRDKIDVAASTSEDEVRTLALANPRAAAFIGSGLVQKVIYIPGKLVNIVVKA